MKYLEIIYNPTNGNILTTKMHGKIDTVIPIGYIMKTVPFIKGMRNNLDSKLFNGTEFINNPNYILSINEKIEFAKMKDMTEQIQFIAKKLNLIEEEK